MDQTRSPIFWFHLVQLILYILHVVIHVAMMLYEAGHLRS